MKKLTSCLMFLAVSLQAATYSLVDLGALEDGVNPFNPTTTINAVNLSGRIVGVATSNNTAYTGFIYGGVRTNLGTLGGADCSALGINAANIVCGSATTAGGLTRAFRWTPGATNGAASNPQMTDLGTLSGLNHSEANDINPLGQIAGVCWDAAETTYRAVRFNTNGTIIDIGALLPGILPYSYAYGINPSGQVAGSAYDANWNNPRAFVYTNGPNPRLLGDLTGTNSTGTSEAFAISTTGQIVGYAINNASQQHAFRRLINGVMVDLGTLGGAASSAWSINSNNVVVGISTLADSSEHAFVAASNTMVDLNTQLDTSGNNWVLLKAEYINDYGQIVGYGTSNSVRRGFLLTPKWPVITNQPVSIGVLAGGNAAFTVGVLGSAPFAYQWRLNGTNLTAVNSNSFALSSAQVTNAGSYDVVITNDFGAVTSAVATLTVAGAPTITSIAIANTNALVSFTTATGATYYLEANTNLLSGNWSNVIANTAGNGGVKTLTNFNSGSDLNKFYRVRVTVP